MQYLSGTVVNALREQHGEFLLKELVRRWSNHKIMNQWMQRFFQYLDRCAVIARFFVVGGQANLCIRVGQARLRAKLRL